MIARIVRNPGSPDRSGVETGLNWAPIATMGIPRRNRECSRGTALAISAIETGVCAGDGAAVDKVVGVLDGCKHNTYMRSSMFLWIYRQVDFNVSTTRICYIFHNHLTRSIFHIYQGRYMSLARKTFSILTGC